jgi:hypothetical protein
VARSATTCGAGGTPRPVAPTQADGPWRFWRDINVYENHAFVVSEHIGHGMHVFDLTRLRDVQNAPETFAADAVYTEMSNTHNIAINEDTGFAYLLGTNTCDGGPYMVDIRELQQPEFAGYFVADGYTHDIQCEIYDGPDGRFTRREICFAFNVDTVTIVDVTDKATRCSSRAPATPRPPTRAGAGSRLTATGSWSATSSTSSRRGRQADDVHQDRREPHEPRRGHGERERHDLDGSQPVHQEPLHLRTKYTSGCGSSTAGRSPAAT